MRAILLSLVLLTPSLASASISPRLDAVRRGCGASGQPAAIAHLDSDRGALGEPHPPWARLLRAGRPGCLAVADWLARGAQGAGDRVVDRAVEALVARGDAEVLDRAWGLLGARSDRADATLLTALASRLPSLGDDEARGVAARPSSASRRAGLPLLLGIYSEGRWETLYGRPIWRESALHLAPEPPTPGQVEAARSILQQARGRGETAARFAELAGRLLEEGAPGADRWVPLLAPLVELSGRVDQGTANHAARAIAWGASDPGGPLGILLEDRRLEALSYYLDGLAARLRAKDDLDATLRLLARVSEADLGALSRRAEQMFTTWKRKRA